MLLSQLNRLKFGAQMQWRREQIERGRDLSEILTRKNNDNGYWCAAVLAEYLSSPVHCYVIFCNDFMC